MITQSHNSMAESNDNQIYDQPTNGEKKEVNEI